MRPYRFGTCIVLATLSASSLVACKVTVGASSFVIEPDPVIEEMPQVAASLSAANLEVVSTTMTMQLEFVWIFSDFRNMINRTAYDPSIGFQVTNSDQEFQVVTVPDACANGGTAVMSGRDLDNDGELSNGDTILITFENCSGALYQSLTGSYEQERVNQPWETRETLDVEYFDTLDDQPRRTRLASSYFVSDVLAPGIQSIEYSWSDDDQEYLEYYTTTGEADTDELQLHYTFGCGRVYVLYWAAGEDDVSDDLVVNGVSNVRDVGVFSQSSVEDVRFERLHRSNYPFSGVQSYDSGSSQVCQGAGVDAIVDGDGSNALLTVLGSGNALIAGHDTEGTYFELTTLWPW